MIETILNILAIVTGLAVFGGGTFFYVAIRKGGPDGVVSGLIWGVVACVVFVVAMVFLG